MIGIYNLERGNRPMKYAIQGMGRGTNERRAPQHLLISASTTGPLAHKIVRILPQQPLVKAAEHPLPGSVPQNWQLSCHRIGRRALI